MYGNLDLFVDLTSQMETSSKLSSCAIFFKKQIRFGTPRTTFHSQMSRRFGKQFFVLCSIFDLLG
jgi:hypothetical protein